MEKVKCVRNRVVYAAGETVTHVYVVLDGEFEQERALPTKIVTVPRDGSQESRRVNVLQKRLPEIKDLPSSMRIVTACAGSLLGDEDCVSRDKYSCTVRCKSQTGTVYAIPKELFMSF